MAERISHRREQVESTLKRAVQKVLAEGLSDPRADGTMLTITELHLGDDLKIATIKVSIFPEAKQKLAMHALKSAAPHIRHAASELVALKQMPQFVFEIDHAVKRTGEVLEALAKVNAERAARGESTGNNPPETPAP